MNLSKLLSKIISGLLKLKKESHPFLNDMSTEVMLYFVLLFCLIPHICGMGQTFVFTFYFTKRSEFTTDNFGTFKAYHSRNINEAFSECARFLRKRYECAEIPRKRRLRKDTRTKVAKSAG